MPEPEELYAQYESCLTALEELPKQAVRGLKAARGAEDGATRRADAAFEQETARLAGLRRTVQRRYDAIVTALNGQKVHVPRRVRAETGTAGDETTLAQAITAHAAAAASVDAEIQAAAVADRRARASASSQQQSAAQAAEALRARQEKVRRSREAEARLREDAEARAREVTEKTAARRRRVLIIAGAGTATLITALAALLAIVNQ